MVRAKLCVRTCTTSRRLIPARGPSGSDGRIKPRRELRYRRSLIYKLPVLRWPGATARYSHCNVPVETGTPPRRRHKLHISRFRLKPKVRSFRCVFSQTRTRLRWAPSLFATFGNKRNETAIFSKSNPLALGFDLAGGFAAVWEKTVLVWENKSWDRTDAQTRAGTGDAYSGKIRPSPARGSPRRRCPR